MKKTHVILALAAVVPLAACKDVGLPNRNLPFREAKYAPVKPLVAAVHQEREQAAQTGPQSPSERDRPVAIGGRVYQVSGVAQDMPQGMLRPVGSFQGRSFFALSWDEAPYDRLYTQGSRPGEWWELEIMPDLGPARSPELGEGKRVVGNHGSATGAFPRAETRGEGAEATGGAAEATGGAAEATGGAAEAPPAGATQEAQGAAPTQQADSGQRSDTAQ